MCEVLTQQAVCGVLLPQALCGVVMLCVVFHKLGSVPRFRPSKAEWKARERQQLQAKAGTDRLCTFTLLMHSL